MKEIGGYFELDIFVNNPYHKDVIELNTGRNALIYLIKAKTMKKVYIPYFYVILLAIYLKNIQLNLSIIILIKTLCLYLIRN